MIRSVRLLGLAAVSAALVTTVAACGSSSSSSSSSSSTAAAAAATSSASSGATASADALVTSAYAGTFSAPPTSGPKAASGKNVWVISCGEVASSCAGLADPAMAAGKAAGWTMHLYDAKLNPANYTVGIDQAVADGANGIITVATDCDLAKSALTQAKAAGVKTVGLLSFDCNDPLSDTGAPVYSTFVKFHNLATAGAAVENWQSIVAAWLIQQTGGQAKVIDTSEPGFLVSAHSTKGFTDEIKTCSSCSIAATVTLSPTDLTGGTAASKLQSALVQNPDANAVHILNDAFFTQFANTALKAVGYSKLHVIGGECLDASVTAAIRAGGPEQACVGNPFGWQAWAAVDELNRQFASPGSAPVDEGIGFQLVDKTHNLPASGAWTVPVDYQADYLKVWTGQ